MADDPNKTKFTEDEILLAYALLKYYINNSNEFCDTTKKLHGAIMATWNNIKQEERHQCTASISTNILGTKNERRSIKGGKLEEKLKNTINLFLKTGTANLENSYGNAKNTDIYIPMQEGVESDVINFKNSLDSNNLSSITTGAVHFLLQKFCYKFSSDVEDVVDRTESEKQIVTYTEPFVSNFDEFPSNQLLDKDEYVKDALLHLFYQSPYLILHSYVAKMGKASVLAKIGKELERITDKEINGYFKGGFRYDKLPLEGESNPNTLELFFKKWKTKFSPEYFGSITENELKFRKVTDGEIEEFTRELKNNRYVILFNNFSVSGLDTGLYKFIVKLIGDENTLSKFFITTIDPKFYQNYSYKIEINGLKVEEIQTILSKIHIEQNDSYLHLAQKIKKITDGNADLVKKICDQLSKNDDSFDSIVKGIFDNSENKNWLSHCFKPTWETFLGQNPNRTQLLKKVVFELNEHILGLSRDFLYKIIESDLSDVEKDDYNDALDQFILLGLIKSDKFPTRKIESGKKVSTEESVLSTRHLFFLFVKDKLGNDEEIEEKFKSHRISVFVEEVFNIGYCWNKTYKLRWMDPNWFRLSLENIIEELYCSFLEKSKDNKQDNEMRELCENIYYLIYFTRYYYYVRAINEKKIKFIKYGITISNYCINHNIKSTGGTKGIEIKDGYTWNLRLISCSVYLINAYIKDIYNFDKIKNEINNLSNKTDENYNSYNKIFKEISEPIKGELTQAANFPELYKIEFINYWHAMALFSVFQNQYVAKKNTDKIKHLEEAIEIWENCQKALDVWEKEDIQNAQYNTTGRYLAEAFLKWGMLDKSKFSTAREKFTIFLEEAVRDNFLRGKIVAKYGLLNLDFLDDNSKNGEDLRKEIDLWIKEAQEEDIKDIQSIASLWELKGDSYMKDGVNGEAEKCFKRAIKSDYRISPEKFRRINQKIENLNN